MRATISMIFEVSGDGDLDAQTDLVFEALLALEEEDQTLCDADLDVILSERLVTVRISVMGETLDVVLQTGGSAIRTAIHAAGGGTPGWTNPTPNDAAPYSSDFELRDQRLIPVNS